MNALLRALWNDESGQDMAEYALLLALIAIIVAAAIPQVTTAIETVFGNIATELGGS